MRHPSVLPVMSVTVLLPGVNDAHVAMQCAISGYWAFALVQFAWISVQ